MAVEIEHVERDLQRGRNLLARYPDVSVLQGQFVAESAATDATEIMQARDHENGGSRDVLIAFAPLSNDGSRLAQPHELSIHVIAGAMPIVDVLLMLREKHPEAYEAVRQIVLSGGTDGAVSDLPW